MTGRALLTSHSVASTPHCEHRGCEQPVFRVSIHLVTSPSGDGLQALMISQLCEEHDASFLTELRSLYEMCPPKWIIRGGECTGGEPS